MPLVGDCFPLLPPSYISPFSDLWALLLSGALKENSHWMSPIFSHHCPAVTPKKRASLLTVPCGVRQYFMPSMVLSGSQPSAGSVIATLKDNAPSFLPGPACCSLSIAPAQTQSPSHSKALQSPSVGSVLWSTFAKEKVTGEEGGRESNTHLVLENSPTFD